MLIASLSGFDPKRTFARFARNGSRQDASERGVIAVKELTYISVDIRSPMMPVVVGVGCL